MNVRLKLFVSGQTARSAIAIANIGKIAESRLKDMCTIEIVDIRENSEASVESGIIATPALIKTHPPPTRKLIGDLSDYEEVVSWLGLGEKADEREGKNEE